MDHQAILRILEEGEVSLQGQFVDSSNATFL